MKKLLMSLMMLLATPVFAAAGDVYPVGVSKIVSPADATGLRVYEKAAALGLPGLSEPGAFVEVYRYTYFDKPQTTFFVYVPVALRAAAVVGSVSLLRIETAGLFNSEYPSMIVGVLHISGSESAKVCLNEHSSRISDCEMTPEQKALSGRPFQSFF